MFDTWDAHGYTGQGVIEQNIIWQSTRGGVKISYQGLIPETPPCTYSTIRSSQTMLARHGGYAVGDIHVQSLTASLPYPISIYNNISERIMLRSVIRGRVMALFMRL